MIVGEEEFAVTKEELKETEEKDSADSDIDAPEDFAADEEVLGEEKEKKQKVRCRFCVFFSRTHFIYLEEECLR